MIKDKLQKAAFAAHIAYMLYLIASAIYSMRSDAFDPAGVIIMNALFALLPSLMLLFGYLELIRGKRLGMLWAGIGMGAGIAVVSVIFPEFAKPFGLGFLPLGAFASLYFLFLTLLPLCAWALSEFKAFAARLTVKGVAVALTKAILVIAIGCVSLFLTFKLYDTSFFNGTVMLVNGAAFSLGGIFALIPAVLGVLLCVVILSRKVNVGK